MLVPDRDADDLGAQPAVAALAALAQAGLALATVDAGARLQWWTPAFARLFDLPLAFGQPLQALVGEAAAMRLAAGAPVEHLPASAAAGGAWPWRLQLHGAGAQRALRAELCTDLQRLQADNEALRTRLDLVQSFTRTGVFERDPRTLQGRWDAHMFRIWGLPEQPSGTASPPYDALAEMIVSEDRLKGAFERSLSAAGDHAQRVRIRRPDGALRYLYTRWRVQHDAQGQPCQVLGINTDDTETFELANRAQRLGTELEVTLELGHIAVWRHDLSTDRVLLDARGCAMLGVAYDVQGVPLAELRAQIHPDDRDVPQASAALTLRSGLPSDMELRYPRADGGWKHVLLRRALHRAPDGRLLGFIGVLLDITERVESSRRTRDLTRQLEAAAEAARIGLWSSRFDRRERRWSPRVYALLGLDPAAGPVPLEDWGRRCVHPDDLQRVHSALRSMWQAGAGGIEVEFRIRRPSDSALRWLLIRGQVQPEAGDGSGPRAEGVMIDITEQQQTLRQLRDTVERMSLVNQALGLGTWEVDAESGAVKWDAQMFRLRGVQLGGRVVSLAEMASYRIPKIAGGDGIPGPAPAQRPDLAHRVSGAVPRRPDALADLAVGAGARRAGSPHRAHRHQLGQHRGAPGR